MFLSRFRAEERRGKGKGKGEGKGKGKGEGKGKGKVQPRTVCEGPEGNRGIALLFL